MIRIILLTALLAACALTSACKYKVVPGAVEKAADGSIKGTFQMVKADDGDMATWIRFDGSGHVGGGACLVFRQVSRRDTCENQSQCLEGRPTGASHAYCELGPSPGKTGTCWYSTAALGACLRSGADTLTEGIVYPVSYPTDTPLVGPYKKVYWRVLTCQGLVSGGGAGGKPEVDLRNRWGDILTP